MLPPVEIMVLLHFRVGLNLHVILKWVSQELGAAPIIIASLTKIASFQRWTLWTCVDMLADTYLSTPKGQAPRFPHGWLEISGSTRIPPNMIGWTIGDRVHRKSSVRKVTHPRTIPTLGSLTSEFPWDLVKTLGFKPPLKLLVCMYKHILKVATIHNIL